MPLTSDDPHVGDLAGAALAAELPRGLDDGEDAVHAAVGVGEAAAVGVDGQAAAGVGAAGLEEAHALAGLAEAQRLQHERRAGGEGVVEHHVLEVLRGDPGHRERLLAGQPRGLAAREVAHLGHHDVLGGLAGPAHVHRLLGAVLRAVGPRQDDGAARVGDQADVQEVERVAHRPGGEHVRHRDRLLVARLRVEGGPLPRGHRHLRPLLERGAVLVHVAGGDHPEVGGGAAEAEGDLVLAGEARVAPRAHAHAGPAGLAVGHHRHVAQVMVERGHRVAHHHDERAAPHRGAVHVARGHAEGLAEERGRVLARGEDAVDVAHLEAGVPHGVGDGLEVQGELALPGQRADLVRLVHAHDAGGVGERAQLRGGLRRGAHRALLGWNKGSVTSSVSFE